MRKMLSELLGGLRSLAAEAVNPAVWFIGAAIGLAVCITILFFA